MTFVAITATVAGNPTLGRINKSATTSGSMIVRLDQ
jgi:hypothetical protein